jgi:diguanylate cyclase (GGDEF)-like protein
MAASRPSASHEGTPCRIVVGLRSAGNERLLRDILADHEVVSGAPREAREFAPDTDLVIIDASALSDHREALHHWRQQNSPVVAPVLLIADGRAIPSGGALARELGNSFDDVLRVPAARHEIRARVENLLRLRSLSERQRSSLQQANEALDGATRALDTLHAANAILVRTRDEQSLLEAVCRIVVEQEHYALAWIGFVEAGEDPAIVPAAFAGSASAYVEGLRIDYKTLSDGPAWRAIENAQPVVSPDLLSDQTLRVFHDRLADQGLHSVITLPIHPDSGPAGVLVIYSRMVGNFDHEEREVLQHLAANLEYGIDALRTQIERERQRAAIEDLAYTDALTSLPNRHHLHERLDELLSSDSENEQIATFFIDLDDFKIINDVLGHGTGDAVLRKIANRLASVVRSQDLVARHGGDEFIVVMVDAPRSAEESDHLADRGAFEAAAVAIARRMVEAIGEPILIDGQERRLTASVGITLFPYHGRDARELIDRADTAMYDAKGTDDRVRVFFDGIAARRKRRLSLENQLHDALNAKALAVHYQPVFDLASSRILGAEALVRWPQPDGGFISPAEFIPIAEESGLIVPLGDWVLHTAITQRARWLEAGVDLLMAVNVSVQQLRQSPESGHFLAGSENALDPSRIELEVTESALWDEDDRVCETIERLHERGFGIAVDDFGTGYSSLSRLQGMPITTLKIDKSFVAGLDNNERRAVITRAVHQLADGLGLRSLAEGIETDHQRRHLLALGCKVGQGFWLSGALPPDDFIALVRDRNG